MEGKLGVEKWRFSDERLRTFTCMTVDALLRGGPVVSRRAEYSGQCLEILTVSGLDVLHRACSVALKMGTKELQ